MRRLDPTFAESVMLAAGLRPKTPYPGRNNAPWLSECLTCGTEVTPRFANVQTRGSGCIACRTRNNAERQRLSDAEARATAEAVGYEPLEPYPGSQKTRWRCRCVTCGAVATPMQLNMAKGRGCNLCGYRKSAEKNRINQTTEQRRAYNTQLLDADAVVAEVKGYGFTPEVEFVNSKVPWLLRCDTCGYISTPVIANLRKGHGCIYCSRATRGFRNDRAGSVYVVASEALGLAKVGIANGIARRVKSYTLAGWTLEARHDFPIGREARAVEQHVLRALAAGGHDVGVAAPDDMPNSGHTETVLLDSLPALLAAVESAVRTIASPG